MNTSKVKEFQPLRQNLKTNNPTASNNNRIQNKA